MSIASQVQAFASRLVTEVNAIRKALSGVTDVEYIPNAPNITGQPGDRVLVPSHVDGTDSQVTHPSIIHIPEGWNGWEYWMLITPYPANNDAHEDPVLNVSHDGITWVAAPGAPLPLDDAAGGDPNGYNSDTDIAMGPDNTMYAFWRFYNTTTVGTEEKVYFRTSTNGVTWTTKTLAWQLNKNTSRLLSPSFVYENGAWTMWATQIVGTYRMVRARSTSKQPTAWGTVSDVNMPAMQATKRFWHSKVIKHNGRYSGLINDTNATTNGFEGDILFMTSPDGINWTHSGVPVIPRSKGSEYSELYRSTLWPAYENGVMGFRVWYSTKQGTTNYLYRTWIGDKSPLVTSLGTPAFRVEVDTVKAIAQNTWYRLDDVNLAPPIFNNGFTYSDGIVTVQRTGVYSISCSVNLNTGASAGRIYAQLLRNSTTPGTNVLVGGNSVQRNLAAFSGIVKLYAGDIVRFYVMQEVDASRNITAEAFTNYSIAYVTE